MLLLNLIITIGFTSLKIKDTETYCVFIKNRFQSYLFYACGALRAHLDFNS